LQFLDDLESAWIQLESLDNADHLSNDYKIQIIGEKFSDSIYNQLVLLAMEMPEAMTFPDLLRKL